MSWYFLSSYLYAVFKVHKNVSTWKTVVCDKLACLSTSAFSSIGISCHDRENLFSRFTFFTTDVLSASGDNEIRTRDLLLARQALSQLSYTPVGFIYKKVGLSGLEPPTSRLSGVRSNRLSYKPSYFFKGFGSHLLSHTVTSAVPSAAWVLTIVFGMGTGVAPPAHRPRNVLCL